MTEPVRVLVIAPYAEIKPLIEEVAGEYPAIETEIFVGSYEEAVNRYPFLLTGAPGSGTDILVARGYTAEQLIRASCFPVVEIETSLYDTLLTIKLAQQRDCRFAVMGSKAIIAAARQLIAILRMDTVPLIDIPDRAAALTQARALKESGVSLIVGDLFAVDACHTLGVDALLIGSGKASIQQTFLNVMRLYQNISACNRHCAAYCQALACGGQTVLLYDDRFQPLYSSEGRTPPLPPELAGELPKYLAQLQSPETVTLKKTVEGVLYRLSLTRLRAANALYAVYASPYKKYAPSALDDFLRVVNPLECFEGDILLSDIPQLFDIHPLPQGAKADGLTSVMFYGARGTGKEFLARACWKNGAYANAPLLILDCAALTPEKWALLADPPESPLHELGYTLLLKNLHKLSPALQATLDQYLDYTCYLRNHLLLSTSDVHLGAMAAQGTFLPALYRKAAACEQYLPALNEKPESIKAIADLCIPQWNARYGAEVIGLEADALAALTQYQWKGNIQQLQDVMRYLVLHAQGHYITAQEVSGALGRFLSVESDLTAQPLLLSGTLAEMESQLVRIVAREMDGHYAEVAKRLGISRTTLWRMLKPIAFDH